VRCAMGLIKTSWGNEFQYSQMAHSTWARPVLLIARAEESCWTLYGHGNGLIEYQICLAFLHVVEVVLATFSVLKCTFSRPFQYIGNCSIGDCTPAIDFFRSLHVSAHHVVGLGPAHES